jgi:multidrug efflux pump subunit AcrA (membrane-fusion protein)
MLIRTVQFPGKLFMWPTMQQLQTTSPLMFVMFLPDEVPEFMRSGMTSNVNIEVARKENVLLLPLTAIIMDQEGSRVRLKQNEDKSSVIPVETGSDDGKQTEIVSGLSDNDIVLVEETEKKFGSKKSGSPFMPTGPRGGGGGRRR